MMDNPDDMDGCDVCGEDHDTSACPVLATSDDTTPPTVTRARLTIPYFLEVEDGDEVSVVTRELVVNKTRLGPYEAPRRMDMEAAATDFFLKMNMRGSGEGVFLDTTLESECNWLCLVRTARSLDEMNCMALQMGMEIYFVTTRDVREGEELKVWYAPHYAKKLGRSPAPDGVTKTMLHQTPMLLQFTQGNVEFVTEEEEDNQGSYQQDPVAQLVQAAMPQMENSDAYVQIPEGGMVAGKDVVMCDRCLMLFRTDELLRNHECTPPPPQQHPHTASTSTATTSTATRVQDVIEKITAAASSATNTTTTAAVIGATSEQQSVLGLLTDPCTSHVRVGVGVGASTTEIECETKLYKCPRCTRLYDCTKALAQHIKEHLFRDMGGGRLKRSRKRKLSLEPAPPPAYTMDDEGNVVPHVQKRRGRPPKKKVTEVEVIVEQKEEEEDEQQEEEKEEEVVGFHEDDSGKRRSSRISSGKVKITRAFKLLNIKEETLDDDDTDYQPNIKIEKGVGNKKDSEEVKATSSEENQPEEQETVSLDTVAEFSIKGSTSGTAQKLLETMQDMPAEVAELLGSCIDENSTGNLTSIAVQDTDKSTADTEDTEEADGASLQPEISLEIIREPDLNESMPEVIEKPESGSESEKENVTKQSDEFVEKQDLIEKYQSEKKIIYDMATGMMKCIECDKEFKGRKCFENHLRKHEGLFYCNRCRRNFCTEKKQKNHLCVKAKKSLDYAKVEGGFECKTCNGFVDTEQEIQAHVASHKREISCHVCGLMFTRKEGLLNHKCATDGSNAHAELFPCDFCGKRYETEKYLMRHMASHAGDFACEKCHKQFARKENLLQHLLVCEPEQLERRNIACFPCKVCKKVFTKERSLQNHLNKHTGEHTCRKCHKEFTNASLLGRHDCVPVDIDDKSLTCKECGKHFTKMKQLIEHVVLHTGKYTCYICHLPFMRKNDLVRHTLICSAKIQKETTGTICCSICDMTFSCPKAFQEHYDTHTHAYKCETCHKKYKLQIHLDSHKCQENDGDFICGQCGRHFTEERYLNKHLELHKAKPYCCDVCKKTFSRPNFANNHVCVDESGKPVRVQRLFDKEYRNKIERKAVQKVVCPVCGHSFHNSSNLNKHLITHGEKKEECDICHKMFHLKVALKAHREEVHTNVYKFKCKFCQKLMKSRNSLYGHMNQFHSENIPVYTCSDCGKIFRQKGNLKKHRLTHRATKTYRCEECPKTFKYLEQLRRHSAWHVAGEQYECRQCGESFVTQTDMQKHINQVHAGVVYACEFCAVTCHHATTLKRHLARRHADLAHSAPQINTFQYIQTRRQIRSAESGALIQLAEEDEGKEGPVLLAQIEGPDGKQSQTVIIQAPPGSKLDGNNLTPEIYEVLKNLSQRVGNLDGTNIMVSQIEPDISQNAPDGLLLGTEGTDFNVGDTEADTTKEYLEMEQQQQPQSEVLKYVEQLQTDVKAIPGTNRVIVSDGDKQIEVDITPTFQDYAQGTVKMESFLSTESAVTSAFSMGDAGNAQINQGQFVMADGTQLQLNQDEYMAPEQQEVLVHVDENMGLPSGLSLQQMQDLIQQQLLQQIQSQESHVQVDISQLDQVQQQIAMGEQVQLGAGQVQLGASQMQLGEQIASQIGGHQMQDDQVLYQVQINADQVPQQVQMLADQVLGQQS